MLRMYNINSILKGGKGVYAVGVWKAVFGYRPMTGKSRVLPTGSPTHMACLGPSNQQESVRTFPEP